MDFEPLKAPPCRRMGASPVFRVRSSVCDDIDAPTVHVQLATDPRSVAATGTTGQLDARDAVQLTASLFPSPLTASGG